VQSDDTLAQAFAEARGVVDRVSLRSQFGSLPVGVPSMCTDCKVWSEEWFEQCQTYTQAFWEIRNCWTQAWLCAVIADRAAFTDARLRTMLDVPVVSNRGSLAASGRSGKVQ